MDNVNDINKGKGKKVENRRIPKFLYNWSSPEGSRGDKTGISTDRNDSKILSERLANMRRSYELPESGVQICLSDYKPYSEPGTSKDISIKNDLEEKQTRRLKKGERQSIYSLKNRIKKMEQLLSEEQARNPDIERILALRREASACIQAEAIDHDVPKFLDELLIGSQKLAGYIALGELQKAGDHLAEYEESTQLLMNNFGKLFPEAAKLTQKSPAALDWTQKAAQAGVVFGGYAEEGPLKISGAYCYGERVYIPKGQTDPFRTMSDFLFELSNAIHHSEHANLDEEASKGGKGRLTAKTYAYESTKLETKGSMERAKIWLEIKRANRKLTKLLDAYDQAFDLPYYLAVTEGKLSEDDFVKAILRGPYEDQSTGKTPEEYYTQRYETLAQYTQERATQQPRDTVSLSHGRGDQDQSRPSATEAF